jgi:DNA polymerase-4
MPDPPPDPPPGLPLDDSSEPPPSIMHVDMDAFFVSVELLDHPELRGRPVIVGGAGQRGVVAAASYEARAYGVHSAMSSVRAQQLCPHAVFLQGHHERYVDVSGSVMAIFGSYTPLVEPLSLDEAFLDVGGSWRSHGPAPRIAHRIREQVQAELGLTCSVGVAPTKFVAKLASEAAKPSAAVSGPQPGLGVKVVAPSQVLGFLHPLPVTALWGVGPATVGRLERLGISTVGDLAALPIEVVVSALGSANGRHLHALANGIDGRRVDPHRRAKSIGHEETYAHDVHDPALLDAELVRFADAVATRLRHLGVGGRTVSIKVRFPDFRTISRASTMASPTDAGRDLIREARSLLAQVDVGPGVRLLGLSISGLVEEPAHQLSFDDVGAPGSVETDRLVDEIRGRFGADAIGPATLLKADGLRTKRRGDQRWGPGADTDSASEPKPHEPDGRGR